MCVFLQKINGRTATRQRHARSKDGYTLLGGPNDEDLEVVHYPEPQRVFGTGSVVDFL